MIQIGRDMAFSEPSSPMGKLSKMIIDGVCTEIVSTEMVEMLQLKVQRMEAPFQLAWVHDQSYHMEVTSSVFLLGKYRDQVLCDMILMTTRDLLLDRSWLFDYSMGHNARDNSCTFMDCRMGFILRPQKTKAASMFTHQRPAG